MNSRKILLFPALIVWMSLHAGCFFLTNDSAVSSTEDWQLLDQVTVRLRGITQDVKGLSKGAYRLTSRTGEATAHHYCLPLHHPRAAELDSLPLGTILKVSGSGRIIGAATGNIYWELDLKEWQQQK